MTSSNPILIIKTGSTMQRLRDRRGDYEDWITRALGSDFSVQVCHVQHEKLPAHQNIRAAIITGSSALITDREAWSENTKTWLTPIVRLGIPTLGICYGHQLLAEALGGRSGFNPRGREIGTIQVDLTENAQDDLLFGSLESTLTVHASHRQVVLQPPPEATILGANSMDPHQIIRFGPRVWGVQFHPEWDDDVIRTYLETRIDILSQEGLTPETLLADVQASGHGTYLLQRFGQLIQERA